MMNPSSPLGERAYEFIETHCFTPAWYENDKLHVPLAILVSILVWKLQTALNMPLISTFSLPSILLYIAGIAIDGITTDRMFRLKPEFDQRNLTFPISEAARLLPAEPTRKDLFISWNSVFMLAIMPVVVLIPAVNVGAFMLRLLAALNNIRKAKRLRLAIKLVDKKRASPQVPISPKELLAL